MHACIRINSDDGRIDSADDAWVCLPAVWTFGAQQLDGSMLLVGDIMVTGLAAVKENAGKFEKKGTKIRR